MLQTFNENRELRINENIDVKRAAEYLESSEDLRAITLKHIKIFGKNLQKGEIDLDNSIHKKYLLKFISLCSTYINESEGLLNISKHKLIELNINEIINHLIDELDFSETPELEEIRDGLLYLLNFLEDC